jgi:hypothetical protein
MRQQTLLASMPLLLSCWLAACVPMGDPGGPSLREEGGTARPASEPDRPAQAPDPVSFPEAEKALTQAVPEFASGWGKPPPTVLRAYPMDPDWSMNRSDTGQIIGRVTRSVLFIRGGQSGRCRQLLCNLREEEQGGRWGRPMIQCVPEFTTSVTCESVDALRGTPP